MSLTVEEIREVHNYLARKYLTRRQRAWIKLKVMYRRCRG